MLYTCKYILYFRKTHIDACGAVFTQCKSETRSHVDPRKIPRELREPQNARPPGTFTVNVPRRVVPVLARKGNDPEELKVSALECRFVPRALSWKVYFLRARASKREEVVGEFTCSEYTILEMFANVQHLTECRENRAQALEIEMLNIKKELWI